MCGPCCSMTLVDTGSKSIISHPELLRMAKQKKLFHRFFPLNGENSNRKQCYVKLIPVAAFSWMSGSLTWELESISW